MSSGALSRLSAANFQFLLHYPISTFFQSMLAVYLVPPIHTLLFSVLFFSPFSVFFWPYGPPQPPLPLPLCLLHTLYPLRIFTRTALPTIRTHYCQLCHLRSPESQKKGRMGQQDANGAEVGVYVSEAFIAFWILPRSTDCN